MSERYRDYCLILNNHTQKEYDTLKELCMKSAQYAIIGKEVGKNGTPHLQVFIYFKTQREFSAIKKKNPRAHIERKVSNSTFKQASDYCKKDNDFWEFGELPVDRQVNRWAELDSDIREGLSWEELTSKFPDIAIKFVGGLRTHYESHRPKYRYQLPEPRRPFQQEIIDYISGEVSDRKILWICDFVGNAGKSRLADHLICNNNVMVLGNGKSADIALTWNGEHVAFDFSRSQQEHINYGVLEDLKNGRVFSPKYQSCVKFFKPIHLVVFANFWPDTTKMSKDRWDIRTMSEMYELIKCE